MMFCTMVIVKYFALQKRERRIAIHHALQGVNRGTIPVNKLNENRVSKLNENHYINIAQHVYKKPHLSKFSF